MMEELKNKRPLGFKCISDKHIIGIFCAKTGLVDYARKTNITFRRNGEVKRLFDKGVADAYQYELSDIAYDINIMRNSSPSGVDAFDKFIKYKCSNHILTQIHEAISTAEDWESDKQKSYDELAVMV